MADRIVIIGPGRMGLALGTALLQTDLPERLTFFGRGIDPPPHPLFERTIGSGDVTPVHYGRLPAALADDTSIVILAVPDRALDEVAAGLAATGPAPAGCAALHLSGVSTTDVLAPLKEAGYSLGSVHPLQAVADPWLRGERLVGAAYAIGGESEARAAARRIVKALQGLPLVVKPSLRPVYHAAAVMVSNYTVALLNVGARLMVQAGVPEKDAIPALLPLLRGTVANMEQLGVPSALTGPIARGDADTVRLHLARLSGRDRVLYCALGLEMLDLARNAGLDAGRAGEIESILVSS